jgi:hypothetical protein
MWFGSSILLFRIAATMPESSANSSQPDNGPAAALDDFVAVPLL